MSALSIIGRVVFALPLFMMGMNHFMNLEKMAAYAKSKKLPLPKLSVLVSGIVLIIGLLGLVFSYQVLISGILVALFLMGTALMMHNFWSIKDPDMRMMEMTQFMKDMALAGASLAFIALL